MYHFCGDIIQSTTLAFKTHELAQVYWSSSLCSCTGSKNLAEPSPSYLKGDTPGMKTLNCPLLLLVRRFTVTWLASWILPPQHCCICLKWIFSAWFVRAPKGKSWNLTAHVTGCCLLCLPPNACKHGWVLLNHNSLWMSFIMKVTPRPDLSAVLVYACCPDVIAKSSPCLVPEGTWFGSKVGKASLTPFYL